MDHVIFKRTAWSTSLTSRRHTPSNIPPYTCSAHLAIASSSTLLTHHCSLPQVYREVAVFENMNPGGAYSNRIQQLGTFASSLAKPQQRLLCEDINDPLYGNSGSAQERAALLAAVHELRIACRGLLQKLMLLQTRWLHLADGLAAPACWTHLPPLPLYSGMAQKSVMQLSSV